MSNPEKQTTNIREHLANERTFLAWMRTSIGIMAFGFVVVKFALFVKQISMMLGKEDLIHSTGYSGIVGIILVSVGTVTAILSFIKYKRTEKQLNEGNYKYSSLLITLLTVFIFLISLFLIVYLIKST
ncbi:MAG: YidH family protein [Lutibacter sp.]